MTEEEIAAFERVKEFLGLDNRDIAELFDIKPATLSSSTARYRYKRAFTKITELVIEVSKKKLENSIKL